MVGRNLMSTLTLGLGMVFLGACQGPNLSLIKDSPLFLKKNEIVNEEEKATNITGSSTAKTVALGEMLKRSLSNVNQGSDFASVMRAALEDDPFIVSKRRTVNAKWAAIGAREAQKDFQVDGTVYGGVEDITDNTKGIAFSLRASRIIYDGGLLDARIASERFEAEAAQLEFQAILDQRAYRLAEIWVEFEKYQTLNEQINSRLAVLDPLIGQLEQVAKAGIGDVSKVTAAQRTVASIRVTQSNISEGLAQSELNFLNAFGSLQNEIKFDAAFIENLLPSKIDLELAKESPLLLSQYAEYQAGLANIEALNAKSGFNVGFEARAMRPYAGSGYDSDESIGLVARKTLFNGGLEESQLGEAQEILEASAEQIKATFREGVNNIETAQQSIESMDKAIVLARENAQITADEIIYLKQQLVIGGSTLDSVLSAEARLYEAESKEINFIAEKRKSQLAIVSSLGLLSNSLGLKGM